jgi:hypothetical protein
MFAPTPFWRVNWHDLRETEKLPFLHVGESAERLAMAVGSPSWVVYAAILGANVIFGLFVLFNGCRFNFSVFCFFPLPALTVAHFI